MKTRSFCSFFSLKHFITLCTLPRIVVAESAWNGYTPTQSGSGLFTSFYVPPGAKGYFATSSLLLYKGCWDTNYSPLFENKAIRSTSQKKASVSLSFDGTGIELFGNCEKRHGNITVRVDSQPGIVINTYCDSSHPRTGQRHYAKYDLPLGHHTVTVVNEDGVFTVNGFVVTRVATSSPRSVSSRGNSPTWSLTQKGSTGVSAMQLAITSNKHAIIIDKVEHNPLTIDGIPVWASLYDLDTHNLTPLKMESNSFCAGGAFLGNGTLINVGGNPVVADHTSPSDFGDLDGLQAIRLLEPCDSGSCSIYENHDHLRMASPRWYNTVVRIDDGSAMIIGGSKKGGWINNQTVNNPTIEYFPPKDIHGSKGLPIQMPFLKDTLNSNLFPIAFSLPDGRVFIAANNDAMIYDWKTNIERRLPPIPNGVRVTYPMTGTGLLLPLSSQNDYEPEILLCGGSTVDDTKAGSEISSQDAASSQCSRIVLTDEGIKAGWEVDHMPSARTMPDAVLLPNGQVVIVNGAGTGISGYGNVLNQVGVSNADNPVLTPCLYDPSAKLGSRFTSDSMPTSDISRMYHSVATLTPSGSIMIAGSNPNLDRSELKYGTEYRVEWLDPPYKHAPRPEILTFDSSIDFGRESNLGVKRVNSDSNLRVVLMDFGYVTHGVHANSRMVYLDVTGRSGNTLTIKGPPNGGVYPPGPGFLCIVEDGVPSPCVKILIGDGKGPEVNPEATENLLKSTQVDQYEKSKAKHSKGDDDSE
ncbi:hypothetical protein GYMLUDRAFT_60089 [Collybiopsis luxurians FD-317 M1]|uniref:Copper radical oxidase n=1 Tax=Collybiopsis luxurians FD-317 M1 TaxID=944289 RepID=A0A0D0CUN4_9AGAR|nr:hypothetical protein GYMLUDRAFT_60089 [Collybiopsis luxurians FD-317 M1]